MKKKAKLSDVLSNPLKLAILGNIAMLFARFLYTNDLFYGFLLWNLFLASIPLFISRTLLKLDLRIGIKFFFLLTVWLLFLPNAPYIITDLKHLAHRPPVPYWYDILLVLLSAFNGLILGFISLTHIELVLWRKQITKHMELFRIAVISTMSYGVYVGRYLRFNSWDAFLNPLTLVKEIVNSIDLGTIAFTITFAFVTYLLYSIFSLYMYLVTRIVYNNIQTSYKKNFMIPIKWLTKSHKSFNL